MLAQRQAIWIQTEMTPVSNRSLCFRVVRVALLGLLVPSFVGLIALNIHAQAKSDDVRMLEGLRTRQLLAMAESYARERVGREDLDSKTRAEIVVQWMKVISDRAMATDVDRRTPVWQQAHEVATSFLQKHPDDAYDLLIRVQDILTTLAEGRVLRQEFEAGRNDDSLRQLALTQLRLAADRLAEIDQELNAEIPRRYREPASDDQLSAPQLLTLQNHVRFYRARALLNRALLFSDADRLNRIDALNQVLEQFELVLEKADQRVSFWWDVQVDRLEALRRMEEWNSASAILKQLAIDEASPRIQSQLQAQAIHLAIESGKLADALELIKAPPAVGEELAPQYKLAVLATFLAAANSTELPSQQKKIWRERGLRLTNEIEQLHGPYWGRLANQSLLGNISEEGDGSFELLARVGDDAYRRGQLVEAIAAYEKGAAAARAIQDNLGWFDLTYKACLVLHQNKNYEAASLQLRAISTAESQHPQAAAAHLLAAWQVSQILGQQPDRLPEYIGLLNQHVDLWPEDPSSNQARLWLGKVQRYQKEYSDALNRLLEVDGSSEMFPAAATLADNTAVAWLNELRAKGEETDRRAAEIATRMEKKAKSITEQMGWTTGSRQLITSAVRLRLSHGINQFTVAEQSIRFALKADGDRDSTWKREAETLLLIALAGQPEENDSAVTSDELLKQLSPLQLVDLAVELNRIARQRPDGDRRKVSTLILKVVDLIDATGDELSADEAVTVGLLRADAFRQVDLPAQAARVFAGLIKKVPNNGTVREAYAEFLGGVSDKQSQDAALQQWRIIARGSRPQSDRWFRAKYKVAEILYHLGQKDDARKLLLYLKETPPGWEQSTLKQPFESLLLKCQE